MNNNSSKEKNTVTFEMLSDWHIGTGAGIPGSVDALVARDADGLSCIPAKTVIGIWRDAMEILTLGLDNGDVENKNWQNWVEVIFGSQPNVEKNPNETPRPARLSIQPARLDKNLRNAIKDNVPVKQALTFVKPNTAVESESGTAKTDSLRFTEMGRIGSVLSCNFSLDIEDLEDKTKELIKALLTASAGLVERIGGNRRRGSGKCVMKVDCGLTDSLKILEGYKNRKNLPEIPETPTKEELEPAEKAVSDEWKRIEFSLKLETPVAIVTATLGNVSETLDFIPGTYLLPHITKTLGKTVSKYIASGDLRVLPATIEVEGNRGLPVPKVLYYHKVEGGFDKEKTVYNRLEENISGGEQKKNYREGYVSNLGENGTLLPNYETTQKIMLMHNTVDDSVQRPTSEVGGVFSRQAIKAGQTLRGEIRLKKSIADDLDKEKLKKLNSYVRLGTSKKDDYGLADLTLGEIEDAVSNASGDKKLIVYLESDVLLRNENLRQSNLVGDLKNELEKTLGKNVLKCAEKDSLIQVRRIESWHEGWGFPRPTLTAMAAGSVAVFEVVGTIDNTNLQNLELSGIGERRGEGYGQIKFNPRILTEKINDWAVSQPNGKPKDDEKEREKAIENLREQIKNADKFKAFIQNLELAARRDEISRAVLKIADNPKNREKIFGFKNDSPPMSQIGGLRSIISKVNLDGSNKHIVANWLKHLNDTPNRKEKWKHGFGKIEKLFSDNSEIWNLLEKKDDEGKPIYFNKPQLLISEENELKAKLWAEAVKSLFDACARAEKRDREDE